MSTQRGSKLFAALGSVIDVFGSAAAAAAAVETGQVPNAKHLKTLGIEADFFRNIRRS